MTKILKKVMTQPKRVISSRIRSRGIKRLEMAKNEKRNGRTLIEDNNMRYRKNRKIVHRKYSTVTPIFKNKTVFLIGGGPSLENFNWDLLKEKSIIAINKSFLSVPWAQVIYWTDSRFYTWYKDKIDELTAEKYTVGVGSQYKPDVKLLQKGMRHGLELTNDKLAHGDNSGYAAINLAYHLGAKNIILLGYDMGIKGNKTHFHDGYPVKPTSKAIYHNRFIKAFPHILEPLEKRGVKVYNISNNNLLDCFKKTTIEAALNFS